MLSLRNKEKVKSGGPIMSCRVKKDASSTQQQQERSLQRPEQIMGNSDSQRKGEIKVKRCRRKDTIQVSHCPSGYIKI